MSTTFDLLWQAGRLASLTLGGARGRCDGVQAIYALDGGLLLVAGTVGLVGLARGCGGQSGAVVSPPSHAAAKPGFSR